MIDIKTRELPGGLIASAYLISSACLIQGSVADRLSGALLLFGLSFVIAFVSRGLGGGDVKIFGAVGLFSGCIRGLELMMVSFLLSGLAAAVIKVLQLVLPGREDLQKIKEIPLVPFITAAVCLQWLGSINIS